MGDDSVQISAADRDLAIRTMIGEESTPHGQAAVASTILNRAQSGNYGGKALAGVVLARNQFEPWARNPSALLKISPDDPRYQQAAAIFDATASGKIPDLTGGSTHFYGPGAQAALGRAAPSWAQGQQGLKIGDSLFYAPEGRVNYQPQGAQMAKQSDPFSEYETAPAAPQSKSAPAGTAAANDPLDAWGAYSRAHGLPDKGLPAAGGKTEPATKASASPDASDPFSEYETAAAAPASGPTVRAVPADAKPGSNGLMWNADGGYDPKTGELVVAGKPMGNAPSQALSTAAGVVEGVPIAGPVLLSGAQKVAAASSALQSGAPDNALSQAQAANQGYIDQSKAAYPTSNALGQVGGAVLGTAPLMAAAPGAFGLGGYGFVGNSFASAASGGALSLADTYARGGDLSALEKSGATGAALGLAAPGVGMAIGGGVNALSNGLARVSPAARDVASLLSGIGKTPEQARADLVRIGPHATLADIDPMLSDETGGIAAYGGAPTSILKTAMKERAAGADDRMAQLINDTLGPKPDAQKIVADIRAREGAMATDKDTARAAIDNSMGAVKDPYAELQTMVKERSAAAQPLYEKAMQGGSMAPLEHQFTAAFADAAETSSKAAQDLAAARQQQLLARAQVSRAGDNVYANNSALEASRQADAAVAQAEKASSVADANKEAIRTRLQQAQADGSANAPGAVWNPRIQQFLDDPITQAGLAKGVRIHRLESLAEGKPFDPTEHAIVGQDEAGNPIVGAVPNMRTLNVAKKGLDSMVEAAKDPITGRLSEEGRAIDQVRRAFLSELDKANPDYAAARQAWAGPTQTHEAFNKGLSIFQNRSGPSGVNSTPGALSSWLATASDGEKEAAKLGARSAFEQQMAAASDPASKAAALANKEVNAQKLTAILGKDEAGKLTDRLNFKYEDPAGQAFEKGMGLFKQREGVAGIEDTPDALKKWLKTASPAEIEAHRQGARQAIEQSITSAAQGDVSKARSLFAKNSANREKLDAVFPNAGKLFDGLDNELRMRATEQNVASGSQTASRRAIAERRAPPQQAVGGMDVAAPLIGQAIGGGAGAAAGSALKMGWNGWRNALASSAHSRLQEGVARGLSATGAVQQQFLDEIARASKTGRSINALSTGAGAAANLLLRSQSRPLGNAFQLPSYENGR